MTSVEIHEARAVDAKLKLAYYTGQSDRHPHGISGLRFLLPPEDSKHCRDTSPTAYQFSEWGNAAGFPDDMTEGNKMDIVGQLRRAKNMTLQVGAMWRLCDTAADEIERLRAELARATAPVDASALRGIAERDANG